MKRKSALKIDTDSEEEGSKPSSREKTPPKQTKPGAKLKKMVVLSDEDEDDEPILPPPKAKAKRGLKAKATLLDFDDDEIPSKEEMSLRAMMDIDDGMAPFILLVLNNILIPRPQTKSSASPIPAPHLYLHLQKPDWSLSLISNRPNLSRKPTSLTAMSRWWTPTST